MSIRKIKGPLDTFYEVGQAVPAAAGGINLSHGSPKFKCGQ